MKHGPPLRALRLASTSAASAAACAASKRCRRAAYSGPVSQWAASPFNAASSPTSPERSRAVPLVTSFESYGPIYEPPSMRRHQDRGSEGFRGLFSAPEGVSLRIGSVGVSRSAAPRTGVRLGKLGRKLPSFSRAFRIRSEPSVVRPGCAVSAPVGVPSATQGYPCTARALRGYGNASSSPRTPYATRVAVSSPEPLL